MYNIYIRLHDYFISKHGKVARSILFRSAAAAAAAAAALKFSRAFLNFAKPSTVCSIPRVLNSQIRGFTRSRLFRYMFLHLLPGRTRGI